MAKVEHVFVLMLENRSFDHMLGFSALSGVDAENNNRTSIRGLTGEESNSFDGKVYRVTSDAQFTMPDDPGHEFLDVLDQLCRVDAYTPPYPPIDNSGFVHAYACGGNRKNPGEVMRCFNTARDLPILYALAREFAVCDAWHSSLPGPTVPNRMFAHGASSIGLDHSPSGGDIASHEMIAGYAFPGGTIFDALKRAGKNYHLYAGDNMPLVATLKGIQTRDIDPLSVLGADLQREDFPYQYVFIEPSYDVFNDYRGGTCQHPLADVRRGEALIHELYLGLRGSPVWEKSLFIIVWDEHGGFYDHVAPPRTVAPGDVQVPGAEQNQYGFTFEQLGVRVPAVVISPFIPQSTIDHRVYDHASIPATVEAVFGLTSFTQRDEHARNVLSLLSLDEPRATLTRLPKPMDPQKMAASVLKGTSMLARPTDPIAGVDVTIVHTAMKQDLELSPGAEEEILARIAALRTRKDAMDYVRDVQLRAQRARR